MDISIIIALIYIAVLNFITFSVYGIDKAKAKNGKWRISEKTLILLAVIGGSVGAILGMYIFHHKTKHAKFYVGLPLILVLQISAVVVLRIVPELL